MERRGDGVRAKRPRDTEDGEGRYADRDRDRDRAPRPQGRGFGGGGFRGGGNFAFGGGGFRGGRFGGFGGRGGRFGGRGGRGGFRGREEIKRDEVCPFLLRLFFRTDFSNLEEFQGEADNKDEMHVHTWKDATLEEITRLIQAVKAETNDPNGRLHYSIVSPDAHGQLALHDIGFAHAKRKSDDVQLQDTPFKVGDSLAVRFENLPFSDNYLPGAIQAAVAHLAPGSAPETPASDAGKP